MRKLLSLFLLLGCLVGCNSKRVVVPIEPPIETIQPDTLAIPAFSGEVLYLFGREYVAIHDSLSPKYNHPNAVKVREENVSMAQYLEQRLQEWYPNVAYTGMIRNWHKIALQLANVEPNQIQVFVNREFGGIKPQGHFTQSASDIEEMIAMRMSNEECAVFNNLNTLATAENFANPSALQHASFSMGKDSTQAFSPDIKESFDKENILTSLMLAGGPYAFYRVLLSKQRAEHQAKALYGENTNKGKQGDAFKHIYVNVLLRTYTTEEIAEYVMDDVWEQVHINKPCDKYMDLHNNQIGRKLRYWNFHENTDDWRKWAEHVHQFIQDSTQASFKHWDNETPLFDVLYDVRQTPEKQYIYWNKEYITPSIVEE